MMRRSEQTIGQRIILTFIIVFVILLILSFIGWISGSWDETPAAPLPSSAFDGRLIDLDKEGLDAAYRSRVQHLFEIWMKDEAGQPGRAIVGVQQARRAYIEAMTKVTEREGKQ